MPLNRLAEVSEVLPRILGRHPDLVERLGDPSPPAAELVAEAVAAVAGQDDDGACRALRRIKYREVARLVLQDLDGGVEAVSDVCARLSELADALCEAALRHADARVSARAGRPDGWAPGEGFVVMALGKHGAGELNYSSDIDLILITAEPRGQTDGGKPISARRWCDRVAAAFAATLAEPTPDGLCFRVDLNLRPDGAAGPPTLPIAAAELYYLSWGRTWERAAWLKARPCAGDFRLGNDLLELLEPFRFRRSMDFATLDDLAAMRDRIAAASRAAELQDDLKRGPGGIREVEFLVQAHQLVSAGRDPTLRVRSTLGALTALVEAGALPEAIDSVQLAADYCLLRAVEHRVQWWQEAQTQRLPAAADAAAWARIAGALDRSAEALSDDLAAARSRIEAAWEGLMVRDGGGEAPALDPFATGDERLAALSELGFTDAPTAARHLDALARVGGRDRMSPAAWRKFEQVAPRLLQAAGASVAPQTALSRLEQFVGRVGARGTTYSLLAGNDAVVDTLVRLFASSAYLSELLLSHPELLDALVLRGRGGERPPRSAADLDAELAPVLAALSPDDAMLAMRTFHSTELLRIGLADLADALPDHGLPGPWLRELATTLVRAAADQARRRMVDRHGELPGRDGPRPFAVLGLGSVGSGWMSYGSDVDLAFVYGDAPGEPSDGARPLDPTTWATRWAQRLVTTLSAPTREGSCYEVDLRLRPDGASGPVVVTLDGLRAYYARRAHPFERIALCRASVLGAPPAFAAALDDALAVARLAPDAAALVAEAQDMRARQLAALGPAPASGQHLKLGPGGIVDLEFAVACAQATRPPGHPATAAADPLLAISLLPELVPDPSALTEAWLLLRRVEAQLRLRSGRAERWFRLDSEDAEAVAAGLGRSPQELGVQLDAARRLIQAGSQALRSRVATGAGA